MARISGYSGALSSRLSEKLTRTAVAPGKAFHFGWISVSTALRNASVWLSWTLPANRA